MPFMPGRGLLEGVGEAQHPGVLPGAAADHQSDRQALSGKAARDGDGRLTREIEDAGVLAAFLVVFRWLRSDGRRRNRGCRHRQHVGALQYAFHPHLELGPMRLGRLVRRPIVSGHGRKAGTERLAERLGVIVQRLPVNVDDFGERRVCGGVGLVAVGQSDRLDPRPELPKKPRVPAPRRQ